MKPHHFSYLTLALFGLLGLAAVPAKGAIIYSELFNNAGGNQPSNSVGWNAYVGTGATDISNVAPGASGDRMGVAPLTGNPASDGAGYFFAANGTAQMTWSGVDTGLSLSDVTDITWRMGNSTTSATVRFLVQVDGAWYASAAVFSNTSTYSGGTFSSAGASSDVVQSFTYSLDASDWLDMTLLPGDSMALGSATALDLPNSPITGVGFFVNSNGATTTVRLDTLEINASPVPEPTSQALIAACILGAYCFRRRKATV